MLDSIAEGIYAVDMQGNCTFCNSRSAALLGYESPAELIGKNMHRLIHHKHRDGRRYPVEDCKIYKAFRTQTKVHVDDEVFWRKDGSRFDTEYWSYPIIESEQAVGYVVSFIDISTRRADAVYRNHLARLVESSCDAILSRDLDNRITSWNEGATEIYGYESDKVIGQPVSILFPEGQEQEEAQIQLAIAEGRELAQFEVKRKCKNNEIRDISITLSPLLNSDHELTGYSSIERDVTENRKSQDAIQNAVTAAEHAKALANQANSSRAAFLANVSHELRTPMNAILGMVNLALEEDLSPLVRDYLSTARSSADSLLELVNELLDFAKMESGKFEIVNEKFDVCDVIDGPAKIMATQCGEKGLEILCEIDNNIPAELIGDGRRIQQVITNLLSNAVKFTQVGEIVVTASAVRKLPFETRVRFSVSDTGIGIAPEDQEKVLLPFKQVDMSSTRQVHGTGLGLSICRELVSLMGGNLQLESTLGKGTQFYFDLTLRVAQDSTPHHQIPSDLVQDLKVLIVDDNPTNLRILKKIFKNWSMQPIVTDNAESAFQLLKEYQHKGEAFALAIIDSLMPKMDGYDLAKLVEREIGERSPPIVLMQAAGDMTIHAEKAAEAPVARFLAKPVSQSELLNAVVETLDLFSDIDESRIGDFPEVSPVPPVTLSILLVEDLPANQKVARTVLEKRGHHVTVASNGRVALDQIQSEESTFDVVLMDIQMPVMDGIQATGAIRSLADPAVAQIPIIAMTAHAMQGDRESCLAAGMDSYISKPLEASRLIELVESIARHGDHRLGESSEHGSGLDSPRTPPSDPRAESSNHQGDRQQGIEPEDLRQDSQGGETERMVQLEESLARLGNDQELLHDFIEIFLEDAPQILDDLEVALQESAAERVCKAAHALKGLMSNFGATQCCELALEFEQAGRNQRLDPLSGKLPKLRRLYEQLRAELKAILKS